MEGDNRWLIGDGDSGRAMKGRPLPHSRLIGEGDTTIVSQARLAREPWPATCHNNVSFFYERLPVMSVPGPWAMPYIIPEWESGDQVPSLPIMGQSRQLTLSLPILTHSQLAEKF